MVKTKEKLDASKAKPSTLEQDFNRLTGENNNQDTEYSDKLISALRQQSSPSELSPAPQVNAVEKPTETLNVRIPKSLSEKIDDYLYRAKKQGQPITKQSLTHSALLDYFQEQN